MNTNESQQPNSGGEMPQQDGACDVPIEELLSHVPIDHRLIIEQEHGSHHIPVGYHCHKAADKIVELKRALTAANEKLAAAEETISAYPEGAIETLKKWFDQKKRAESAEASLAVCSNILSHILDCFLDPENSTVEHIAPTAPMNGQISVGTYRNGRTALASIAPVAQTDAGCEWETVSPPRICGKVTAFTDPRGKRFCADHANSIMKRFGQERLKPVAPVAEGEDVCPICGKPWEECNAVKACQQFPPHTQGEQADE